MHAYKADTVRGKENMSPKAKQEIRKQADLVTANSIKLSEATEYQEYDKIPEAVTRIRKAIETIQNITPLLPW